MADNSEQTASARPSAPPIGATEVPGPLGRGIRLGMRMRLRQNLQGWPARRWLAAIGAAVVTFLIVAVPTDLINTTLFSRAVPPTPWAVPVLAVTAVLTGMLTATYVARPAGGIRRSTTRLGTIGSLASFFAVGCPVCNKLVLIALGASGAIQYFAPLQPYLAAVSILLLLIALARRLIFEDSCPLPRASA